MKKAVIVSIFVCLLIIVNTAMADTFGIGVNQFTIDFVNISGNASSANGTYIGEEGWPPDAPIKSVVFTDPGSDYRVSKFEITNDQWNKSKSAYGTITGNPLTSYNDDPYWTGYSVPTTRVSWYEAAQFVNWLNTSTGHTAAYKFTGTQGTSNYTFTVWDATDAGYNAINPYRNSNTFYFLPTENEWVKAAYWNGTYLQNYANASSEDLLDGIPDPTKWNYTPLSTSEPWGVGSGVPELNGTFDMMGNVWEWMESPWYSGDYISDAYRGLRGGSYYYTQSDYLSLFVRGDYYPLDEYNNIGFRVASIPEPASLLLLAFGGLLIRKR